MSGRGSSAAASSSREDTAAAGSTGQTNAVTTGEDGGQVGGEQTVEIDALDLLYADTPLGPSTAQLATQAYAQGASKMGMDPFPGVISLADAAAYNASVRATIVGGGQDDYDAEARGYALSHEELNAWRGTYDDAVKQHGGRFDNSDVVEAAFQRNEDILAKADLDWAQQGRDFAKLYGEQVLYAAAGEGAGFVVAKAIGAASPYIAVGIARIGERFTGGCGG